MIVLACGAVRAQVSKEVFEKMVDHVNCKAIELTLAKIPEQYKQYQKDCPCQDDPGFTKISAFLTTGSDYDATIALSKEIETLKSLSGEIKKEALVSFLSDEIFKNNVQYQKLFAFAGKRKNDPAFPIFKESLKNDLAAILATDTLIRQQEKAAGDNENVPQENKAAVNDRKSFFGGFSFEIDILSILIAVLVVLLLLRFGKKSSSSKKDRVPGNIKGYVEKKLDDALFTMHSDIDITGLRKEIRDLRSQLERIGNKVENQKTSEILSPKYDQPSYASWQEAKQPEIKPQQDILFLSTPNADGSFNESSASPNFREGASIYRFTKITNTRAKFQIEERDASVKLALQYPDKNIDPVCDAVNPYNPKARKIVTTEAGEVELVNDKWMKSIKARIRYED